MPKSGSNRVCRKVLVIKGYKNMMSIFRTEHYEPKLCIWISFWSGTLDECMNKLGYPIVGDTTYSNGKNEWGVQGQCLHAKSLKFKHPITGKDMFLEAPLPEYFQNVIKELKNRD